MRVGAAVLFALVAAAIVAPAAGSAPRSSAFPAEGTLLRGQVAVRAAPRPDARVVTVLHRFRSDFRPQIVLALGSRSGPGGNPWLRLSLPMRPNGTTGWIPASWARVVRVRVVLVVHRGLRRLDVFRDGRRIDRMRIAVGKPGAETPLGRFYIAARFASHDPFYGPFGLETSAYSRLSEWPGGGVVGIHGTDMPWLLGRAVSHGCVRVANDAVLRLKREVPLGSLIRIVRR